MIVYKEIRSVEQDLQISAKTLFAVSNSISHHYRAVSILKRDGSYRHLSVPDGILKKIQRSINENLLAYMPISRYATAYRFDSGIKRNALPHVNQKKILKLDIKDFFDSILFSQLRSLVFPETVYSREISILLSILCYHKESLPQGAPTSPAISNIILKDFDDRIGKLCRQKGIRYSRYCDDMTFSGDFDHGELVSTVKEALKPYGFFLNEKKTGVYTKGSRQTVTGVVVNSKINAPSATKRKLRQEIYYCRKYGVEEHMRALKITLTKEKYLQSLLGKVNFVLSLSQGNEEFAEYKAWLVSAIKSK